MESFNDQLKRIAAEKEARKKEELRVRQASEREQELQVANEIRDIANARRKLINEQVVPYNNLIQNRLSRLGKETWGLFSLRGSRANLYYTKPERVTSIGQTMDSSDLLGFWRNGRINWRWDSKHQAINHEDEINKYLRDYGSDTATAEYYQVEYPMQEGEGYFYLMGADSFRVRGSELDEGFLKLFKCGPYHDTNPFHTLRD